MRANPLSWQDRQGEQAWSGLPQRLQCPPCPSSQLQVELSIRAAEVVTGYLADAPEPVLESAAVHRERSGSRVVAAATGQVFAQGPHELSTVDAVVLKQGTEPVTGKRLHRGGIGVSGQYLVHTEVIKQGDLIAASNCFLDAEGKLRFAVGAREVSDLMAAPADPDAAVRTVQLSNYRGPETLPARFRVR